MTSNISESRCVFCFPQDAAVLSVFFSSLNLNNSDGFRQNEVCSVYISQMCGTMLSTASITKQPLVCYCCTFILISLYFYSGAHTQKSICISAFKHNQSNSAFRIWLFFILLTESWDVFVKDYFNGMGLVKQKVNTKGGKLFILDNQKMFFLLVMHVCWSPSLCAHFSHLPMAHKMGCIPSKAARTTSLFPNWCLSF